jgi:type II secretory pathway pseudopilin PulG
MSGLSRARRGVTLLESIATMAVLVVGILAVSMTVLAASRQNRRNLAQAQASLIAEQELERITAIGCTGPTTTPCDNIQSMDGRTRQVFWATDGEPRAQAPGQRFDIAVDVDPNNTATPYEGTARGSPALDRTEGGQQLRQVINVRVTVSWQDTLLPGFGTTPLRRAVALQTRMVP